MSDSLVINAHEQIPTDLLTSSGNRLESKIRAAQGTSGEMRKSELKKAAQDFEAIFISYMLKVMRETIEESGLMEGGFGKTIYTELFDQEVSLSLARRGALGISDLLYNSLKNIVVEEGTDYAPPGENGVNSPLANPSQTAPNAPGTSKDAVQEISDLQLPVRAPLSSGFGIRNDPFTHKPKLHKGIDLAAPEGMRVISALPGKVISAGFDNEYGNTVLIQHAEGIQTRYGHMGEISVKAGDNVASEETLGRVGSTGRSTGPHLHFEVIRMGKPVDPILSFNSGTLIPDSGLGS